MCLDGNPDARQLEVLKTLAQRDAPKNQRRLQVKGEVETMRHVAQVLHEKTQHKWLQHEIKCDDELQFYVFYHRLVMDCVSKWMGEPDTNWPTETQS